MENPGVNERAQRYADRNRIEFIQQLGFGNDGVVWSTRDNTAVKVFERTANFTRELGCYNRLKERSVNELLGFTVPQIVQSDSELRVIEMEIVTPPYLLDFGKAYLDAPPDFSAEVMAEWEAERAELFEPGQWQRVRAVLRRLQAIGIFYYDAKPANICFG